MVVHSCIWFHSVCTLVLNFRIQLHLYSDTELETVLTVFTKQCCCLGIPFFWHRWTLWYWLAFQCNLFLPSCSILLTCIMTTASIDLLCICALWLDWRLSIQILYQLLQNVEQHDQAAQSFYQTYFTDILQHIFSVVTDTSHTAGE